jgi:hypothetical protein
MMVMIVFLIFIWKWIDQINILKMLYRFIYLIINIFQMIMLVWYVYFNFCMIGMQFFLFPRKVAIPPPGATPAVVATVVAANNAAAIMFATVQNDLAPLRDLCYILLRRTQPDGPVFVRSISSVLAREVYWQNWKAGGALSFEKSSTNPRQAAPESSALSSIDETTAIGLKRARSGQAIAQGSTSAAAARRNRFGPLGSSQRPSQRPLNWASIGLSRPLLDVCRDPIRAVRPQLLAYIVPLRVALDYRTGIEEEFSPAKDRLYVWRGLRFPERSFVIGECAQLSVGFDSWYG